MTYSYQELKNKLKKINEDQLKTIKDNIEWVIDYHAKGHGELQDNINKLIGFVDEQKRIESEIKALI